MALILLSIGHAMKVEKFGSCVVVSKTLSSGDLFRWVGAANNGRWEVCFTINGEFELGHCSAPKTEVMKLVLAISASFSKYPCACSGATGYHTKMWRKLGFVDDPNEPDCLIRNP